MSDTSERVPILDTRTFFALKNDWDEFDTVYALDKSTRPYRVVGSLSGKRPRDSVCFFQVFRFLNTASDEDARRVMNYAIRRFDSYGDRRCRCRVNFRCPFHYEGDWHKYLKES